MSNPPDAAPLSATAQIADEIERYAFSMEQVATIKARLGTSSAQALAEVVSRLIATVEVKDAGHLRALSREVEQQVRAEEAEATIATLTADKAAAEASLAVVVEALKLISDIEKIHGEQFGPWESFTDYSTQQTEWRCHGCEAIGTSKWPGWELQLTHDDGCRYVHFRNAIASIPTAAQDLLERVSGMERTILESNADIVAMRKRAETAEGSARTPGTVEVCKECGTDLNWIEDFGCRYAFGVHCPIKRTASKET